MYFVFHMFDTVFYVKNNSFKNVSSCNVLWVFNVYFFNNVIYFSYL